MDHTWLRRLAHALFFEISELKNTNELHCDRRSLATATRQPFDRRIKEVSSIEEVINFDVVDTISRAHDGLKHVMRARDGF